MLYIFHLGLHVSINKNFQRKIVNIFLPIILSICFGAQKNRLIGVRTTYVSVKK